MAGRYDRITSLIWLTTSLVVIAGSAQYPFGAWSHPGPAFLPILCGAAMAALSLIVFLQSIWKAQGNRKEEKRTPFLTARWPRLVVALAILLVYAFLLDYLGYLVMTFVFMLFVLKIVEPTKWRIAILEAVLAAAGSYLLFEIMLKMVLPRGIWPPGIF